VGDVTPQGVILDANFAMQDQPIQVHLELVGLDKRASQSHSQEQQDQAQQAAPASGQAGSPVEGVQGQGQPAGGSALSPEEGVQPLHAPHMQSELTTAQLQQQRVLQQGSAALAGLGR